MKQKLLKSVQKTAIRAGEAAIAQAHQACDEADFWRKAVELLEMLVAEKCGDCEYNGNCEGCDDYEYEEYDFDDDDEDEDNR